MANSKNFAVCRIFLPLLYLVWTLQPYFCFYFFPALGKGIYLVLLNQKTHCMYSLVWKGLSEKCLAILPRSKHHYILTPSFICGVITSSPYVAGGQSGSKNCRWCKIWGWRKLRLINSGRIDLSDICADLGLRIFWRQVCTIVFAGMFIAHFSFTKMTKSNQAQVEEITNHIHPEQSEKALHVWLVNHRKADSLRLSMARHQVARISWLSDMIITN